MSQLCGVQAVRGLSCAGFKLVVRKHHQLPRRAQYKLQHKLLLLMAQMHHKLLLLMAAGLETCKCRLTTASAANYYCFWLLGSKRANADQLTPGLRTIYQSTQMCEACKCRLTNTGARPHCRSPPASHHPSRCACVRWCLRSLPSASATSPDSECNWPSYLLRLRVPWSSALCSGEETA
jgi:hypothetical protein